MGFCALQLKRNIICQIIILSEIANGKVVAIAIKGKIHKVHDLSDVFKAIESLTGSQTPLRNVDSGSAYGMLMIKGNYHL